MDKSSVVNQFTNYVDQLRTQECSQKEKINCFQHIAECILSPAMVSHINYATHCSNATSVLLLFCEDLDSVVRMSAEENLNRIFRSLEKNRVKRILMDLYGEIKKNGNQRSLRICLNLFSYYAPLIKEKHISSYALRLLPCLQTIAQRKETQLCETLCEFIKSFAKYLQMGLNDSETCKLFDAFIANIGSECAVKRRCSSQNCISLIENSRNRSLMAKHALNKAIDILLGDDHQNTNNLLGTLGFLRILLPLIIREDSKGANIYRRSNSSNSSCGSNNKSDETWYIQDAKQIIEIYDFCLHLLSTNHTSNHSIINASLEVINSILQSLDGTETSAAGKTLEHLLCNHQLQHNEYLRKRKSLKNQIFQLKNFQMTCNLSAVGGTRSCGSGGVRKSGGIPAVPVAMSKVTSSPMRTANVEAEQRRCWMPAALRQASSPNSSESLLGTGDGNGNGDGGGGASEWNKHKTTRMTTTRMTAAAVATATAVTAVTRGKSPVEEIVRDACKLGMEKTLSLSLEESCQPTPPPRRHHNQQQYQHQQSGMHHHPNARTSISRSRSSSSSSAIFDAKCDDSQRYGNGNAKVNNKKNSSSSGISVDEVAGCTVVSPTSTSTSTPANDELQLKNHKDDQHHHRIIDDDDDNDNDNGNDNEDEDDEDGFTTLLEVNEPLQDDSHLSLSSSKEFLPPSTALISAGTKTPIATTVTIDVNLLIEDDEDAEGEGGLGGCAAADGGSCDDKSQFLSDIDNESFNSIDFESEITIGGSSGIGSGVSGEHDNNNSDNKDAESTSRVIPSLAGGAPSSSSLSSSLLRRTTLPAMMTTTATGSVNSSGVGSIGGGGSSKSSDTIGSFFNNLLSHSSAESMTKLFRSTPKPIPLPPVTDTTQVPATINSPQSKTQQQQQQQEDADNLSLESINSHISLGSHVSLPTNSSSSRNEQDLVMVAHHSASGTGTATGNSNGNGNGNGIATTSGTASAVVNDDALSSASATASTALLMDNTNTRNTSDGSDDDDEGESSVTKSQQHEVDMDMDMDMDMGSGADIEQPMQLNIGTIYDQAIIYYTSRLIVVKFLLTGQRGGLQSDTTIRVSIKHLSLNVIAHCARLMPDILRLPVEISAAEIRRTQLALQIPEEDEQLTTGHSSNNSSDTSSSSNVGKDFDHLTDECRSEEFPQLGEFEAGNLLPLEIKDDHFGVSTTNDFLNQPLSRSADPLLLFAELGAGTTKHQEKSPKLKRSHKRAEQILSKSEIIESKTSRNSGRGSGSQVKGALPAAPTVVDGLQPITSQLRDISIGKSAAEKFNLVNKQTGNVDIHIPGSGIGSGSGSGNGNDTFPGTGIGIGIYDINQMQQEIHQQILSDVLLFYSHSDPILRGDVQIIIGNFVQSTLGFYHNRNELFDVEVSDGDGNVGGNRERSRTTCLRSPLEINRLLAILIKGLQDDIHTVVIHALNAFDKIFPLWMSKYLTATYKQGMTTTTTTTKTATTMCDSRKSHQQLPDATNDDVGTPDTSNDTGMSNGSSQKQDLQHLLYADDDTLLEDLLKCFKFDHEQSIETSSTMMATAATTTTNTTTAVLVSALASALNEKVNCAMETGPQPSTSADRNHYYGGQVDRELFIISPKLLLSKLRLCYHNKYWLVLNKYAEVISNLDYGAIREHYGNDMASTYENTFLDELLQLVGDDDFRVREHTADCLCRFIIQISGNRCRRRRQHEHSPRSRTTTATTVTSTTTTPAGRFAMSSEEELYRSNFNLLWDLYDYRIFQGMSMPIRDLFTEPGPSERLANGEVLAKVLYRLTNKLMELNDRNLQLGIIYALKVLLKAFNFFDFREVWMEFNFVEICFKFAYYNYVTALDLNCQNDLMEVTGTLIAGNVLTSNVISHSRFIDNLLAHTLKIINIYYHLFTNQKPLLFAKVQRNDLFANTKELAIVNSVGYFGNDYVYIKLYNILKSANDSYKMTINQVSGAKLMSLLRTCINTFSTCIELRVNCGDSSPSSNPIKLIEETIQYLTKLINYAPTECIASLRQLLKFLFGRNYGSRCNDYQHFINPYLAAKPTIAGTVGGCSANSSSTHFRTTSVYDNGVIGSGGGGGGIQTTNSTITTNSTVVFGQLFATGLEFPLWKTDWENDCAKYIKLFEPLVIYCLTLFMRSNARIQASILELLSQLLELNVTYSILDSKYLIFEEIMNNLELIETGVARNGTTIIPPVLKFLVQLTYKSDRKIITVPKIISIANNLLANNSIRECSVLALKGLAFEIFLMPATLSGSSTIEASQPHRPAPPPPTGVPARFPVSSSVTGASPLRLVNGSNTTNVQRSSINSITALDAKELETQKEVVLGMLEKFIDSQECQRMLAILLLQDRSWHSVVALQQQNLNQQQRKQDHSMDVSHQGVGSPTFQIMPLLLPSPTSSMQEGAIYSIVTKGLCDGKIKVHDWQGFFVLESLFQNSGKNILLDSKEFSSMLALFITKDVDSFSDLSCATIILENVILKTEEIYLVNHVKLYLKNHFDKCVVAGAGVRGSSAITTTQGMTLFELSGYPHLQSMSSSSSSSVGVLEHMVDAADYGSRYVSSLPSTSRAAASAAVATANITSTVTINEINYFAKVLCEKLDGCLATLAKCRTPPNRKYCGLVVRFVRALYAITEKREDSLQPAIRRLLSVEYNFWDRYNLNGLSTDEGLQLEMLKLFVAIKLQSDRTSVLQELQKDGIKWNVQRTLLREICLKLEEDLPATNWDCSELQQLFSRRFLNILIKDNLPSIRLLCEGNENVCSLFLRALIKNCDALNKSAIRRVVVQFIGKQDYNLMHCIDAQVELLTRLFDLAEGYGNKLLEGVIVRTSRRIIAEHDHKLAVRQNFLKIHNAKLKRILFEEGIDAGADEAISRRCEQRIIDEKWLFTQVMKSSSSADPRRLSQILLEITSEYKLSKIFSSPEFDEQNILTSAIDTSLKSMLSSFRNNCIQFNPHIHYMNVNPLAKVAIATLMTRIDNYESLSHNNTKNLPLYLATAVISLMENLKHIEEVALIYIESKFIDKFIKEHLLRPELMVALKKFLQICCIHIKSCLMGQRPEAVDGALDMYTYSYCVDVMLKYSFIWNELNASSEEDEQHSSDAQLLSDVFNMLFAVVTQSMGNTIFYKKYKAKLLVATPQAVSVTQRAIFLAKLMETKLEVDERLRGAKTKGATVPMRILKSIGISILRTNRFYAYAVTPLEIYHQSGCTGAAAGVGAEGANLGGGGSNAAGGYESQIKSSNGKLPSIPVEHLSDADVLQKFVKRLSIFGFTTRQQFEEYFMTFLLLINKVYDENMVDVEEQFQIKSICLEAILELLITYKTFPIVGSKLSYFHHTTRWSRINCNSISLKKLHKVQLLVSDLNIFYHPNLERTLSVGDVGGKIKNNIIGTTSFQPNQYDLNFIWQQMEAYNSPSSPSRRDSGVSGDPALLSSTSGELAGRIVGGHSTGADAREDVFARNFRHFTEHSGIDFRSSSQLIFDVLMQINEHNHVLALPNLVKFCEICDSRDQIKLIRDKALKFQETIPMDDTITHQYVIYLLCKTQAMLIPSPNELSHLCTLAAAYLKSSHVFIRNATLSGLLCLLECCSKTNTTIGKLSEELSMLRDLIVGYINRHGIIEESSSMQCHSDTHMKLVWTLNFSLIEWTAKFVTQCHLLSNTIIWANKFLKRTTNEDIYLCVLHGLERIIVINAATPEMRNKIEKLALDLMKLENERFSIPALKLLLSCMYMGSSKQLENTELSNGIVQDDPEIIAQQTDKVDILLHCIKSSTRSAAWIYGQVLCQIIRDLVPPNEILTKVIKEFLAINQPHCDVIASIVHQVFRSAIDSSFLQMLQDWLICSLPTFLALPQQKGVWALTVIFLSASINLHLIKLFPVVLVEFVELGQQEIALFQTSAQDFHSKLSGEQKARFRDAFKRFHQNEIFARMLHSL